MVMARNGVDTMEYSGLNRGMAKPAAAITPQKTITPVSYPGTSPAPAVAAPTPAAPANLPGMSWADYQAQDDVSWNNSDKVNGFGAIGRSVGYNGPVQERSGQQVYVGEGESGPTYEDGWQSAAGLNQALSNYRFSPTKGEDGKPSVQVYDNQGNPLGGAHNVADSGINPWLKAATAAIIGGAGLGAAGVAMGAGGGAGAGAAGGTSGGGFISPEALGLAGEAGATDAWGSTLANSLGEFSLENIGAAAGEGAAGDAATAAAWGEGAAGLGGDTLSAMGVTEGTGLGTAGAYTTAAADSQAANLAMQAAGTPTGAAIPPAGVSLGSLGGGATGGGITDIASALAAAKSGLGSVADFAKANPQLASLGASGAATLLNGSGGNPPAAPGSGSATSGGTSNDALVKALTDKLYGADGSMSKSFDYSSVPELKTSAAEVGQFNQSASDAAYSNATRYLDPQIAQQQQALEARLAEQGFVPGTPGYKQAMANFMDTNQRAYASARDTATLQGFSQGNNQFNQSLSNANLNNSASREKLAQLLAERNQPLNELNALKTGQQLTYENQLGQYNADVTSKNSTNQALSQLALALGIYLG